jgi:hypothetical protein
MKLLPVLPCIKVHTRLYLLFPNLKMSVVPEELETGPVL